MFLARHFVHSYFVRIIYRKYSHSMVDSLTISFLAFKGRITRIVEVLLSFLRN